MCIRDSYNSQQTDFSDENGVDFFRMDRGGNVARGGSPIIVKKNKGTFQQFLPFPSNYETVAALGNIHGYARKLLIVCTYMPPSMSGAPECLNEIVDIINQAKVSTPDPFIIVGGDFNVFSTDPLTCLLYTSPSPRD